MIKWFCLAQFKLDIRIRNTRASSFFAHSFYSLETIAERQFAIMSNKIQKNVNSWEKSHEIKNLWIIILASE